MRRYSTLVLFFVVLLTPAVLRRWIMPAAPRRGSDLRLVIVTPHNQDIRREFARAFDAWHREQYGVGVTVDYRTPGGTADIERQLKSIYDAYRGADGKLPAEIPADIDLVWGGGDFFFDRTLKPLGILQPIPLDPELVEQVFPEPALAGVRLYDATTTPSGEPAPQWVGVCLSSFGIVYNPDLYTSLQLLSPRGWRDLTDPRLSGFVALADPSHSTSAAVAYIMVVQRAMADAEEALFAQAPEMKALTRKERAASARYQQAIALGWKRGMAQLLLIAANARYFTDDSQTVPTDVSRGEAAAGMAIDFYAQTTRQVVGPDRAQFVLPAQATAITPDPIAILAGVRGERLKLARQFVQFLLSARGQRLWALRKGAPAGPRERSLMRPPIRRDVYADQTGWEALDNPFQRAGNFNQRGEWMVLFPDTRMIWVAAWIDSRDALSDAYRRILAVHDQTRRAGLLARLSDLPVEMSDVAEIAVERKKAPPGTLDAWQARLRMSWASRFRRHYRKLEAEAR